MTCVTKCIEPLFSGASKSWPILGRTHASPSPPHSVSPLMPRIEFFSPLFPSLPFLFLSFFSLFFPPLPFSPLCASLTHGSVGKKRRIATGTMRRNWKSPDAENWPFPMIPWIYRALTRDSFEDLLFRPIIIIVVIIIIVSSSPDFYRLSKKLRVFDFSFLEILRFFVGRVFKSKNREMKRTERIVIIHFLLGT